MISPAAFITQARTWVGVPFRHQGRTREGIDCIGLIVAVGVELGAWDWSIDEPDYGKQPQEGRLPAVVEKHCQAISGPEPGCLVLLALSQEIGHVALFTGPTLIHALVGSRGVCEHSYRGRLVTQTRSAWRLPGIEYSP